MPAAHALYMALHDPEVARWFKCPEKVLNSDERDFQVVFSDVLGRLDLFELMDMIRALWTSIEKFKAGGQEAILSDACNVYAIRRGAHGYPKLSQWWLINLREEYGLEHIPVMMSRYIFDWDLGVDELLEIHAFRILIIAKPPFRTRVYKGKRVHNWHRTIENSLREMLGECD